MKRLLASFLLGAVVFAAASSDLAAQLAVAMRLSQKHYLAYESIFVQVAVRNLSAHAVAFGERAELKGSLTFDIQSTADFNKRTLRLRDPKNTPQMTGVIIPPGATREFTFNLLDYYDIQQVERYTIRAVVRHAMFPQEYISDVNYFTVVPGNVLWTSSAGVPDTPGEVRTDEKKPRAVPQRTYSILTYFTGKKHLLVLRIEDKNTVYSCRRLGFDLGKELPIQCQIDFLSRLNVIIAGSPRVYAYYQFSIDGSMEKRKIMIKEGNATPTLSVDPENGYVTVVGGREAQRDVDYEEIKNIPFLGNQRTAGEGKATPPGSLKDLDTVKE